MLTRSNRGRDGICYEYIENVWLLWHFQAEGYFLQSWLRQHGDMAWITKERKWHPDALVNWSPIIRWFITLLKYTLASRAHLPPMHTCLKCTPASSVHLPLVHTYLQCTSASNTHLPPARHKQVLRLFSWSSIIRVMERWEPWQADSLAGRHSEGKPASTSSWPSIPRCWPSYSSWSLENVRVCGLSLKLLFHCYF